MIRLIIAIVLLALPVAAFADTEVSSDASVTVVVVTERTRAFEARFSTTINNSTFVWMRERITKADDVQVGNPVEQAPINKTQSDIAANQVTLDDMTVLTWAQVSEALRKFGDQYAP